MDMDAFEKQEALDNEEFQTIFDTGSSIDFLQR